MSERPERSLIVKLAESAAEVRAAQALRYRVFAEEMGANVPDRAHKQHRDFDQFDDYCDHLIVVDPSLEGDGLGVIGTYRMMRRSRRAPDTGFYTETEYDIDCLTRVKGEIAEVGRSCIDPRYRNKVVMQMLWNGMAAYVSHHDIQMLFGCASFIGTDVDEHAMCLSWLYHNHLAPTSCRPSARSPHMVDMNILAKDDIDEKEALKKMPPLIKGYLRLGATVGDGAVIDYDFKTTDVCIVVRTETIARRYVRHFLGANEAA